MDCLQGLKGTESTIYYSVLYWTHTRRLTYLNYTHSLICNFKEFFNIATFHSYISGVYFCFVIIFVEINVEGVSLEICKEGFYIWPKSQIKTTAQ